MKNQNPQEILNEILLRMKYDMSKTLTENKEIILEQGGNYYTPSGQLIGYPGVNSVNIPASDVYPEIKNNKYPQQADFGKMLTASAGRNIRKSIQQTSKPSGIQTRQEADAEKANQAIQNLPKNWGQPREGAVTPYNYTPSYYPSYRKNQELTDYVSWYNNYTDVAPWQRNFIEEDKPKNVYEIQAFQDFLDDYYPTWLNGGKLNKGQGYGNFGPSTSKTWSQNEKVRADWYQTKNIYLTKKTKSDLQFNKPQTQVSYKDATNLVTPKRYSAEDLEISKKLALKQKRIEIDTASGKLEVPGDAKLEYWTYDDISSFDKFKRNIIDKDNTASILYTLKPPFFTVSKVKSFTIPTKGINIKFKQVINNNTYDGFGALDKDGYLVYYDKWAFFNKTDWEDWGPTLLNIGSIAMALLPATWPYLLISAGMDLYAAKMQYEQGETEGAKLSTLLALTPFIGKLGIKVDSTVSKTLIKKFENAATKSDVDRVISTLSKEELDTLKSLRELGDLKSEVKALAASKEVNDAINIGAKKAPGLGKVAMKKAGLEFSLAGGALGAKWDDLKEETLSQMTRIELLKQLINATASMVDNETQKKEFDKLSQQVGVVATDQIISEFKKLVNEAKQKIKEEENKKIKEADKDINEVSDFILMGNPEDKIGSDSTKIISNINNIGKIILK